MTPSGWTTQRLGEFCHQFKRINSAARDLEPLSVTKDSGIVLQSEKFKKRIATDTSKYKIIRKGEFAFDPMSLYYRAIGRLDRVEEGVVSPAYITFDIDESANRDWFAHLARSDLALNEFIANTQGGNVHGKRKKTDWSAFRSVKLPVPPLPEQTKIAAILSSVDDAIQSTQAVIDQTRQVKKGLLQELLTRGIGPDGRPHRRLKKTEIGEIPESWEVLPIRDLFSVQLGKMMSKEARSGPNQLPYLRNINVRWRRIDTQDVDTIHFSSREQRKFRLCEGDVLMCEGRALGRSAIWSGQLPECYYQKALHRLRSIDGRMLPEFLVNFAFYAFDVVDIFASERLESTIPHLTKERLEKLLVPVPALDEQRLIVRWLDEAWRQITAGERTCDGLSQVKAGLLEDLLTGKVRVTA